MKTDFRWVVALLILLSPAFYAQAKISSPIKLAVGTAYGQIGVTSAPNEECRGPATVTPGPNGSLAILDGINHKIIIVDDAGISEITIPSDLIEPSDFVTTTLGYLVVGALGQIVSVNREGKILARGKSNYDPELGTPRLVVLPGGTLGLENLKGDRVAVDLAHSYTGDISIPGFASAAAYTRTEAGTNKMVITNESLSGPLEKITITSKIRIVDVRVLWAANAEGAFLAVQESRALPEDATFVRLVKVNKEGVPTSEAYLSQQSFGCGTRRPFARLTDGNVVSLKLENNSEINISSLSFSPVGTAVPIAIAKISDISVISDSADVFKALEAANGTTNVTTIALGGTSVASILQRANAALNLKWLLAEKNFSRPDIPNKCNPPAMIWRRPARLNNLLNQYVTAVPYRWGGYVKTLDSFQKNLNDGRLAGDDCTCRNANCVNPDATGQDCSGFVSYAWFTGDYYTTARLPNSSISKPVDWESLAPGDIVNNPGRHVRLVDKVNQGANGRFITVIESTTKESCGGVCRRSYSELELRQGGYKPLRRNNLTD